ncbi:MAG: hypothetical protein MUF40_02545 [Gemmatimonadaceae bacterium]|nr:hypothetical protein [Gemmatimonadaceae bacterium]
MSTRVARRAVVAAIALVAGGAPLAGQGLFRSDEPLAITITTNLRSLVRERDSLKLERWGAVATVTGGTTTPQTIPVTLRARGHYRRQARNCDFPPVRLDAGKGVARGTILQGNTRLKVTTTCRPGSPEYAQYILAEYAVYRAWALLDPLHFRTRLARITWTDSLGRMAPVTSWAFLIEDAEEVADRRGYGVEESQGALFDDVEATSMRRTALFEWLIGNVDWSVSAQHNIGLFRDSTLAIRAAPYDFDFSGAVATRYATPDPRLRITSVTDRLHRGPCLTPEAWAPVVAHVLSKRAAIDSMYASIPDLDPAYLARIRAFWTRGWRTLEDPKAFRSAVIGECQAKGN